MRSYKFPFKDIEWDSNNVSDSIVNELAFPFLLAVDILAEKWAYLKVEGAEDGKKSFDKFTKRKYKMTLLENSFIRCNANNPRGLELRGDLEAAVKAEWKKLGIKFQDSPLQGAGNSECKRIPSNVELDDMSLSSVVNMVQGGSRAAADYCYLAVNETTVVDDAIRKFVSGEIRDVKQKHEDAQPSFSPNQSSRSQSVTNIKDDISQYQIYADILKRRKNIVLEGPPGTGKTHAIKGIVDQLEKNKEKGGEGLEIGGRGKGDWAITMHPATSYEDFIEGLRPAEKSEGKDAKSSFIYKPGVFVERVRDAIQNPHQQHVVLLDELNRSNVPRVFGDLLTTLEASKRTPTKISENYSGAKPKPIECDVVVMAKTKPGAGATKGFSYTTNFGNDGHEIEFVGTTRRGALKHKKFEHTVNQSNRYMPLTNFRDPNMTHELKIEEKDTVAIILVFIDDVYYPVKKGTSFANYILDEQNLNLTKPDEITVIDEKGKEKNYFCSTIERDVFDAGKHTFYHRVTVYVPSPEASTKESDCCKKEPESEYYWCMTCDSLWKEKWGQKSRTEVTLSGSKKKLHIPDNLLVVATMNTTDRSVAPLDAALRRRFVFLRVDPFKKFPKKDKKRLDDEGLKIFDDTEKLWQELNIKLKETLGPDATIGHSYLFDLKDELVLAKSDEKKCDELRKQFWQYSVLPQVADLLDATGRSKAVWEKIGLNENFKDIELSLDNGPEDFKSFARTIVVEVKKKKKKDEEERGEEE